MAKPTLYVFTISHYCEKARWALDHCGIEYTLKPLAPGLHARAAKKLGLEGRSVPFLDAGDVVIHGSSAIIDWAEQTSGQSLSPPNAAAARDIETRLDAKLGVHIRRYYYSEAIVHYPETVQPVFSKGVGVAGKLVVKTQWARIREMMIKGMDLGEAQGAASQAIMDAELDWLDGILADDRRYLVGDAFSRADLTAASLIGPAISAPTHPAYDLIKLPPGVARQMETWADRPSIEHVRRMYAQHR